LVDGPQLHRTLLVSTKKKKKGAAEQKRAGNALPS
jgi:hypothetical protein